MSREQRTRLNVMISEQTGAAASTKAPGRTALTDEELTDEEKAALEQQAAEQEAAPAERKKSVFDSPHAADIAREPADAEEPRSDD